MLQGRLFIVSNRLPINVSKREGKLRWTPSSGGLVTAIQGYLESKEHLSKKPFRKIFWAGVPGCTKSTWDELQLNNSEAFTYVPVFIPSKVYDGYYNGLSNTTIWPLFHYFPSYAEYNPQHYQLYCQANEIFMQALLPHLQDNDTLWIHDYQLLPLCGMIRKMRPTVNIGFFLHIPFPSFEIFRLLPAAWQKSFLEGMMGADLIGFHTIDYLGHFLKCLQNRLSVEADGNMIKYRDRLVCVDIFPISINFDKFHEAYDLPEVVRRRKVLQKQFEGKQILFSVDRLDYTKNVLGRLLGYEAFLNKFPEYVEKVVLVLSVVPSRDNISYYRERKREIDEFIGGFNARRGTLFWKPVIYQYSHLSFRDLMALYTICDAALITPLRDGMNLVAKEFVASRKDQKGVLILSEMAGAARELTDAIMINPNDIEGLAEKIKEALTMPDFEQAAGLERMQNRLRTYTVGVWANEFIEKMMETRKKQVNYAYMPLDHTTRINMLQHYRKAKRRLFLLDYDGTLVNFAPAPDLSVPSEKLLHILKRLTDDPANSLFIISGRSNTSLENWLGNLRLNLVAEHGAMFKLVGKNWMASSVSRRNLEWKQKIIPVMENYVERCPGSFIEEKGFSLVWHYRNADPKLSSCRAEELMSDLAEYAAELDLQVLNGNKIVEMRIKGVDKGWVTRKILEGKSYDFILASGDDKTDEDMFLELQDNPNAYTIKIGTGASYASHCLFTPEMHYSLLEWLMAG